MKKEIPIFFSIDDSYAPYLATALYSAIENSSAANRYRAIVLYENLKEENISRISALATDHFKIDFFPIRSGLESITDRGENRLRCDYFTLTIYFRLFIPELFPQYDKGLYIDSDVVLSADLCELFSTDIGECFIGAATETSVGDIKELTDYMENAVGIAHEKYINSGVLIMNLRALRAARLGERFLYLLDKYHFDSVAPDQDYLNAMCEGRIYYLDGRWNATPNENRAPYSDPKLIHYNLFAKPWCYSGIQYEDEFWRYAEKSGYIDEIRAHKAAYGENKKAADRECAALMIKRGLEIMQNEITFKNIKAKGEKILI